jgi:iron complex transport system ATP-binding protein
MTELKLDNISLAIGGKTILDSVNLTLKTGELAVLLGANGAGKSSVLRCALGLASAATGESSIDQQPLQRISTLQRAKLAAYLPQRRPMAWPVKVFDVVSLGRYAYGVRLGRLKGVDLALVEAAIEACDLQALRNRRMDTLSGGESARVHCARAFAANADLLLADEPNAALDPKHELGIMQLIRNYVDGGRGALVVAHEANLAARFADRLIWMRDGRIYADGSVAETMTAEMMAEIYGVKAQIHQVAGHTNVTVLDAL